MVIESTSYNRLLEAYYSTPGKRLVSSLVEPFSVGVVIIESDLMMMMDPTITAISHLVSGCQVASIVILDHENDNTENNIDSFWSSNGNDWQVKPQVLFGYDGFRTFLNSNVKAVYITLSGENTNRDYIIPALDAGKHVLVKDHVSTFINDYILQLQSANKRERFIQFVTMYQFVNRTQSFSETVLTQFGKIQSIDAILTVSYKDLKSIHMSLPLQPDSGCIRRLGRFCILLSCIMLRQVGSFPVAVKVKDSRKDKNGMEEYAECHLFFSGQERVRFQVGYTHAPTRQILDIKAHDRYASMTDFVIPHPDGLATYRVYDKEYEPLTKRLEVVRGEAIDVPSELPEPVMMWRRFRKQCVAVEQAGWGENPITEEARQLTEVALQTKRILIGLYHSMEREGAEISLQSVEMETPYTPRTVHTSLDGGPTAKIQLPRV